MAHSKEKESEIFFYNLKNPESIGQAGLSTDSSQILSESERIVIKDMQLEYKKCLNDLEKFIEIEIMRLDFRKHKCMVNRCYNDIFKKVPQVRDCTLKCSSGISEMNNFISNVFDESNSEMNICLDNAQKSKYFLMDQTFKCYEQFIKKIPGIKTLILEELKFYKE